MLLLGTAPARAQAPQRATLFTYVAEWGVPRAEWAEINKLNENVQATLDKLLDEGTLVGYGFYENQLHREDGATHANWFQATSIAGILKALDALSATSSASPVLAHSRHRDFLVRSTMYNAKSGTFRGGYLWVGRFAIKPGHVEDWSRLFGTFIKPVLDELLADGTIVAYQLDTQVVHTPDGVSTLSYGYVTSGPDGIDKVQAAIRAAEAKNEAIAGAISPLEEPTGHFDLLARVGVMRRK